jgi:hypothetical protein
VHDEEVLGVVHFAHWYRYRFVPLSSHYALLMFREQNIWSNFPYADCTKPKTRDTQQEPRRSSALLECIKEKMLYCYFTVGLGVEPKINTFMKNICAYFPFFSIP